MITKSCLLINDILLETGWMTNFHAYIKVSMGALTQFRCSKIYYFCSTCLFFTFFPNPFLSKNDVINH